MRDIFGMIAVIAHVPPPPPHRSSPAQPRVHAMPDMIGMDGAIVPAAALQQLTRRG